jgi:hypothetical protein
MNLIAHVIDRHQVDIRRARRARLEVNEVDVRYGSLADVSRFVEHVRFDPESGHLRRPR